MKDLDVGSLPICGKDNRIKGMPTDRDIVIKCVAEGGDARRTTAGDLSQGKPVTIGADDSVEEVIKTIQERKVRRLPLNNGHDLIGMRTQADIARNYPEDRVGELVEFISYQRDATVDSCGLPRSRGQAGCIAYVQDPDCLLIRPT
jgi:CBS-domain-containing membrane protein